MSAEHNERRKSFRSPVAGTREGTLRVGKLDISVRLLDESSDGISVSSEFMPPFGEGEMGEFEYDDGDIVRVKVMHLQQRGLMTRIGMLRLETLKQNGKVLGKISTDGKRRSIVQVALFVLIGMFVGFAPQIGPVRRALAKVPVVNHLVLGEIPAGPIAPKISESLRERLRERFDIDLFADPEMAVLLSLRDDQLKKISSIIKAKGSATQGMVPNSQQTAILYITQFAMLGVLDTEQKYRLESLVQHTIGATDLLQKLVSQYWPNADPAEIYNRLGAPALALPQVAATLNLDEKQLRAIRKVVDEALDKSEEMYRQAKRNPNESELLQSAFHNISQAHEACLSVLREDQKEVLRKMVRNDAETNKQ